MISLTWCLNIILTFFLTLDLKKVATFIVSATCDCPQYVSSS